MGLLAPLLLGGLAFLSVPWLLHRKRKPPRNPTPFSSLMFVPDVPPTTRARKQIEDRWLMALRMLLLALLALAFARPYNFVLATPGAGDRGAALHVLLVDVSASMDADGHGAARDAALAAALEALGRDDQVAVVVFDDVPRVLLPFPGPEATVRGNREDARRALEVLPPPAGGTDYRAALNRAEALLGAIADPEEGPLRREIHLVSDLQRSGLPSDGSPLRLSEANVLWVHAVGGAPADNIAVEEMALVPDGRGNLLVRARLRNFRGEVAEVPVAILIDGELAHEGSLALPGDGSRTLSHLAEVDVSQPHRVAVQVLANDAFTADNTRYGHFSPEAIREIGVVLPGSPAAAAPRFLDAAVADTQPLPWTLRALAGEELAGSPAEAWPPVVVAMGGDVDGGGVARLSEYVAGGGRLLLIPGAEGFGPAMVDAFLGPAGIDVAGRRFESEDSRQYATFAWLDFDHPVFRNFRDPAYSDFSAVRFNNFHTLSVPEDGPAQVLARLEGGGAGREYPALITFDVGEGRVLLWSFPLDPAWTNLMRTRRFVPLLHESLAVLLPSLPAQRSWHTGDVATAPKTLDPDDATITVSMPGVETPATIESVSASLARLGSAGFLQWQVASTEGAEETITEAVNLAARESDLSRFSEEEFRLRVGAAVTGEGAGAGEGGAMAQDIVHWEYGYPILALLLGGYLAEAGLALWLGWQRGGGS